jgi:hypothetical protein
VPREDTLWRLCPICRRPGTIAVVCRPASEHPIGPIPHFRPWPDIARYQQVSHFFLDARRALLRRTCTQIPMACLPIAMWPERLTQKVEALFACLLDAGLGLIQSESQPRHHLPRPYGSHHSAPKSDVFTARLLPTLVDRSIKLSDSTPSLHPHYRTSSLLRVNPPLYTASVLSPSWFEQRSAGEFLAEIEAALRAGQYRPQHSR